MPDKTKTVSYRSVFTITSRSAGDQPDIVSTPVNTNVSLTSTRSVPGPNPNWKKRIARNEEVTSPLSGVRLVVVRRPCKGYYVRDQKNGSDSNWTTGIKVPFRGYPFPTRVTGSPAVSSVQRQLAETIAIRKFHRKVSSLTKQFDGFVFLGELRETLRMLRHPFETIRRQAKKDYLDALTTRKRRDPKGWTKAIAGTWLEFMFGIQPALNDLIGGAEAWKSLQWEPLLRRRIRVSAFDVDQTAVPSTHYWSTDGQAVFTGSTRKFKTKQIVYRALWVRTRTAPENLSLKSRAFESLGLEIRHFVPAVYELLPWSFLVDYVTNLGDVLEQHFTSFADVRYIVGTRIDKSMEETFSAFSEVDTRFNNTTASRRYVKAVPGNPAMLKVTRVSFQRNPVPVWNFPTNGFQWELPSNPLKYANVLALGLQADALYPQRSKVWRPK